MKIIINMKLDTKKKLIKLFLKLISFIYSGGIKFKHNGNNHYVLRGKGIKFNNLIK